MANVSTLASPGVEVREFDESLRTLTSAGTTVFIPGFAAQGPVEEINTVSSMEDFENIYGQPTNAAERYFYYTVKSVVDRVNDGTVVLTSRLAYGAGDGDNVANAFTILAYPAIPVIKAEGNEKGYDYCKIEEEALKPLVALKKFDESTINAQSVTAELLIDSAKKDFDTLKFTKVEIPEGYLPSVGEALVDYTSKPKLTWTLGQTVTETEGAVATETKSGDLLVHLSFALPGLGVLKIDAIYAQADIAQTAYNTLTFKGEEGEATATYVPAFEIAEKYAADEEDVDQEKYKNVTYVIGSPASYQISLTDYYQLISGELLDWENTPYDFSDLGSAAATDEEKFGMYKALKHSAFIIVNPSRTIINDSFEGYYFGITDNMFNEPESDTTYNAIDSVKITTLNSDQTVTGKGILDSQLQTISRGRIDFFLDSNNQGSISQVLQNELTAFDTSAEEYDDTVNFAVFKLRKSTTANEVMKLTYRMVENYNASFGKTRQYSISSSTTPQSYFVENILEDANSRNIGFMVNPYIAKNIFVDIDNKLCGKVRIYSNKLVSNLQRLQSKYITGYTTSVTGTAADKTTIAPIKAADANIQSWANTVRQAGVSLSILAGLADKVTFTQSNSLYPFGAYTANKAANKFIGNVPYKLDRTLGLIANDETYPDIDIICDGGLSTIYVYANATKIIGSGSLVVDADSMTSTEGATARTFDETLILAGIEDLRTGRSSYSDQAQSVIEDYMAVQNVFMGLANSESNGGRGNTFFIGDLPRGVYIKGKNTKVTSLFGSPLTNNSYDDNELVNHSWSTSIVYPHKHLTSSYTSSFTSLYAQWFKVLDSFSGEKIWLPASGKVAANMCRVDALTGPWDAAAGMDNGLISDVLDVAINPTLAQRSDLYKLCINSIPSMPNVGPVIWGIRTMSKKPSAFDQNTCRRTFLYMEKHIKQVLRYFVFKRNDSYTQLRVYNELDPFLASMQSQGAIYSYTLVCDNTNNTEEVINDGNMVVDVSAAPERTIEKIVLNMRANKYTQSITTSYSAS